MEPTKVSDLLVRCLEAEGVTHIFGIPGEENLDFLESLRQSSIQLVVTRHEQAAGFMAATYGRLTGQPGVCLSTLGPGATNLVTPAAYAYLGAMPMFMITGQKPLNSSKQGHFQIIDAVAMLRPITKYSRVVTHGKRIPTLVRECFKIAEAERPGPTHLELPEDIAGETVNETTIFSAEKVRRPDANEKAVSKTLELLEQAQCPIILVGAGANRRLVSKMLQRFIKKTGIPFFNTQMGKGVIPEDSPQYLGCAALSSGDYLHQIIEKADLILNVGHDVVEKPPFFMHSDKAKVVHINFSAAQTDEIYFPQLEIVGDIANALWQLSEKVTPCSHWDFSELQTQAQNFRGELETFKELDDFPFSPRRLVHDVRQALGREDILCLDNGMYKLWFARHYPTYAPNTLLLDNALATMGAGFPSAMAAKLIFPRKKVLAVCGDGGFMMNSQEIETACRLNLDLVVLVLKDNRYGMIGWKQQGNGFEDHGLDFGNPDFVRYAESYGAHGKRIDRVEDLLPQIKESLESPGVHVLEVPISYQKDNELLK